MKHIIQKEQVKTVCDECQREISFEDMLDESGELKFHFGFYSARDGECADFHLCHECVEKLIKLVDEKMHLDIDKKLKKCDNME